MQKPHVYFLWAALICCATTRAESLVPVCYVPGMSGRNALFFEEIPRELAPRGITFKGFDIGVKGTIQQRAQILKEQLEEELRQDSEFRCDVLSHSLAGIVLRYLSNHLMLRHPRWGFVRPSQVIRSVTTVSTPHRGTPLGGLLHVLQGINPGAEQMSEKLIVVFNSPEYPETYSPEPADIPFYSYRTYVRKSHEQEGFFQRIGFNILWEVLSGRRLDPLNDGCVPRESQGFGRELSDVHAIHAYFGSESKIEAPVTDFIEMHVAWLNGRLPEFQLSQPAKWAKLVQVLELDPTRLNP